MQPRERLIGALDFSDRDQIIEAVNRLSGVVGCFKIGLQAFVANGPSIVREIVEKGERVFLDLKIHDIPNTASNAVAEAARSGASIITIHASGGLGMMRACAEVSNENVVLAGVTILTSLDDRALVEIGLPASAADSVVRLAGLAHDAGLEAVVASPLEVALLRESFGRDLVIITPGIRTGDDDKGDQRRTMTPSEAVEAGADYIVVGRPITRADNPRDAASRMLDELA